MPYQPISPSPYLHTIDARQDNFFSCIINPRDTIHKYILTIINIETGENVLTVTEDVQGLQYEGISPYIDEEEQKDMHITTVTDKERLQLPISGNAQYDSQLKILIPANYIIDKSEEDETTKDEDKLYGDYVWNIKLFDFNNKNITSCDYYFMVRDSATVVVKNDDSILSENQKNEITSGHINIIAAYRQAQNILPAYYCFNLYSKNRLVYTTGNVISSNIIFEYDSLISDSDYILELIICDDNKKQIKLEYDLRVEYEYYTSAILPALELNMADGSLNVNYENNISIIGKYEEEFEKPNLLSAENDGFNGVCIPKGQNLYWDEKSDNTSLNLENTSLILNWHGHKGYNGVIIEKLDKEFVFNKVIVGHKIPNTIQHEKTYSSQNSAMPVGFGGNPIQAGFYYIFHTQSEEYISEFSKVSPAIYKASLINEDVNENDIKIDDNTLYVLNDNDELSDKDIILSNDTTYKNWWLICILNNGVKIQKNTEYIEMVVNE